MARGKPRQAPSNDQVAPSSGGDESMSIEALGEPSRLESVAYILAMTKPLVEIAKARNLPSLVYFLEMAVLDAADLEMKLQLANPGSTAKPFGRDGEE